MAASQTLGKQVCEIWGWGWLNPFSSPWPLAVPPGVARVAKLVSYAVVEVAGGYVVYTCIFQEGLLKVRVSSSAKPQGSEGGL